MIILIIIIVALMALVMFFYFNRRREKKTDRTPYVDALVALLKNDHDMAMKKLKEAVNMDSDLVDAYIRLGDLYRERGDVSRAIQIHQSLTIRPTLNRHEEIQVFYALVKDMLASSRHNKAVSFLKEILKIDKKNKHAREMILRIYEDLGNYGDCITQYEEGGFKPKSEARHAFYYASFANNKLRNLENIDPEIEKEGVGLLKKALKILPGSVTALYYLGKYYEKKGDLKKAKEYYYKLITQHPDHAFMIIPEFERVYFELDLFDEIIPIYEKIYYDNPRNFVVGFALAGLYEKKNDTERMKEVYGKLSDVFPDNIIPKLHQLKAMTEDTALIERVSEIENEIAGKHFVCDACKYNTKKFTLLCPECHSIESLSPLL